jgi:hypothetical protein
MLYLQFQIAACTMVAIYLGYSRTILHERNMRSWEQIVGRLDPRWAAGKFAGTAATNPSAVRALHKSAGAVLEMADYAERNCNSIDPKLLAALRNDAIENRIHSWKALSRTVRTRSAR